VAEGEGLADEEYRAHLALHLERELPTGLGPTRGLIGGAFGKGTVARIRATYSAICDEFERRRSDKVFLFGLAAVPLPRALWQVSLRRLACSCESG
jgi:hypothetical protein